MTSKNQKPKNQKNQKKKKKIFLLSENILEMVYNHLSALPEELNEMIWKFYFLKNVASKINKIVSAKKWENPSKRLCLLCGDIGCLQQGDGIDNTMDVLFNKEESYYENPNKCECTNCICFGWPCLNHSVYASDTIGISSLWSIGNKPKSPLPDDLLENLKDDPDMTRFPNIWY